MRRGFGAWLFFLVMLAGVVAAGQGVPSAPSSGGTLLSQGRFEEALSALEVELKARPEETDLGLARVKCLIELGRWREALDSAHELASRFPAREDVRLLLGDCLLLNFRAHEAAENYRAVPATSRWVPAAVGKLANALIAEGEDGEALNILRQARASGTALSDGDLSLQTRIEPDPRTRLALLKELQARRPEESLLKEEIKVCEALAQRPLAPPIPPAYPGKAKIKEIYREPSVAASLDGKAGYWLALDTGSESILLNADTARKLGLSVLATTQYAGWGYRGPQETLVVLLPKVEVAGRTLQDVTALVNRRDAQFWTNKGGYIGLWPFRQDVVLFDRRRGEFGLYPLGTAPEGLLSGSSVSLPILWFRGLPLVQVMLQGKGPYPFLLDTGAPWSLIAAQYAPRLGIRVNSGKYGNLKGVGISGAFSSGIAEQVNFTFAGVRYERRQALVTEIPQRFSVPVYGILGRDVLNDFAMVFDGPGARVVLSKYPN